MFVWCRIIVIELNDTEWWFLIDVVILINVYDLNDKNYKLLPPRQTPNFSYTVGSLQIF